MSILPLFFLRVASLTLLFLCPTTALFAEESSLMVVETEGSTVVAAQDNARAREAAVRDALQKAVEQVASLWLFPHKAAVPPPAVDGRFLSQAEAFVQNYRILSEQAGEVYTVTIRATVFADMVREQLLERGLLAPLPSNVPFRALSLTVRGINDYREYARLTEILKDQRLGIKEALLQEVVRRKARFKLMTTEHTATLAEQLQERLAMDIGPHDDRTLEVTLK